MAVRGGGLRCSGTYGLLSHCYFILEYIIDIVILNSQDTAQYMYFTQYRVSNKDKVATESEPAHGTKVQGPRCAGAAARCGVLCYSFIPGLFIHTRSSSAAARAATVG